MPRGKKKKHNDYDFSSLIPSDFEKYIDDILNYKKYDLSLLKSVIKKVYNFYSEQTKLNPKEYDYFENFFLSKIEHYIAYQEIDFFNYIKKEIETKYRLIDQTRYFGFEQEAAFRKLLKTKDPNRQNILYVRFLEPAFEKMVESIIHKYKLYSKELSFDHLHSATVAFLHEKMYHFDESMGKKAYSYLGTIAIRKLKNDQRKEYKKLKTYINHEDTYREFGDDERLIYHQKPYEDNLNVGFFEKFPKILNEYIETNKYNDFLSQSDIVIGKALVQLMNDWDNIFDLRGNPSNKFKKNSIFEILRNMTGYQTKHVTQALKVYKELYFKEKHEEIQKEYNPYEDIS